MPRLEALAELSVQGHTQKTPHSDSICTPYLSYVDLGGLDHLQHPIHDDATRLSRHWRRVCVVCEHNAQRLKSTCAQLRERKDEDHSPRSWFLSRNEKGKARAGYNTYEQRTSSIHADVCSALPRRPRCCFAANAKGRHRETHVLSPTTVNLVNSAVRPTLACWMVSLAVKQFRAARLTHALACMGPQGSFNVTVGLAPGIRVSE